MIKDEQGKWYVIQTVSGKENLIKENIDNKIKFFNKNMPIYEVFIPVEKISEIKKGERITSQRRIFPGYILIRMDLYDDYNEIRENIWFFIKEIKEIIGFTGCNYHQKPAPLLKSEMNNLMNQLDDKKDHIIPKTSFKIGEIVRIREGAFENFEGNVQNIDYIKGRLKILVSIFGRFTPVELEFSQVEK